MIAPQHSVAVTAGGLLWHTVPKAASASIMRGLRGANIINMLLPTEDADGDRFMVVRNPVERFQSAWCFFRDNPSRRNSVFSDETYAMPWLDGVVNVLDRYQEDRHSIPQAYYHGGKDVRLIRFPELPDAWEQIRKDHPTMRALHKTHVSARPYEPAWPRYLVEKIKSLYAADYELWRAT